MKYQADDLKSFALSVMQKAGLGEQEAETFANSLLFADLRGIGSHGISRLSTYVKRVSCGVIQPNVTPKILHDAGAVITVDGCNGIGASIALQVMYDCIHRAKKYGCCFATVKNGTHFGTGAFLTRYAAHENMIGVAMSNSEAAVVPTGGAKSMLGTNPLSVGIPAENSTFILDMATSVVARGKVVLAKKEGQLIPEGWCVDQHGAPTTDPAAALMGAMLPFGGPKGYGISLMIDILCSCLGGALNCRETPSFWNDFEHLQNVGYFIGVFDVAKFLPVEEFKKKTSAMLQEFKNCPPAPGVQEVMIPGEIEHKRFWENKKNGITLSDAVVSDLKKVAEAYDIPCEFLNA